MPRLSRRSALALMASLPAAALLARSPARAGEPPVFQSRGAAINGYDPVAYFTEGRPVKGDSAHAAEYMGARFHFASAANRDAFAASPARYAPQYGGYCAWAVSQGYTASTDPDAWSVHQGKLYLNYSKGVRRRWSQDIPGNVAKGDANWPAVLN